MALIPQNTHLIAHRDRFKIDLYKRPLTSWKFEIDKSYEVAIGADAYPTPRGLYLISDKQKCPTWVAPDSDWVPPDIRGQKFTCHDPINPIKGRWLGIYEAVGIHGVDPSEYDTIGTKASHGCFRMKIPDVIELFDLVPKYTPIYII